MLCRHTGCGACHADSQARTQHPTPLQLLEHMPPPVRALRRHVWALKVTRHPTPCDLQAHLRRDLLCCTDQQPQTASACEQQLSR